MGKHKKGYFKGKYSGFVIASELAYQINIKGKTKKEAIKKIGLSEKTVKKYLDGNYKKPSKKVLQAVKKIKSHSIVKGKKTERTKHRIAITEKLKKNFPSGKKIKIPSKRISKKELEKIKVLPEIMIEKFFESQDFSGEGRKKK
jgi:hypothetical protein